MAPDEIPAYEAKLAEAATSAEAAVGERVPHPFETIEPRSDALPSVGGIVVGARKWIPEGKDIEKTAIVGGGKETYVDTIADSFGKLLSPEKLAQMGLGDPKTVEKLKKELDKISGGKEWKLEVFDTPNGREYRGVIGDEDEVKTNGEAKAKDKGDGKEDKAEPAERSKSEDQEQKGSEEEYMVKDEL